MWARFQYFGVQNKWDGVWSKSNSLDVETHCSSVMFSYVYVFLLCKEFVEVFIATWNLCFAGE